MSIPSRLIGYGAYNLCFDRWLGKPPSGGPIFFAAIRNGGWPVNLVKVICFRNSGIEGLPETRRVTLYDNRKAINTAFIDNLNNLVDQARQFNFSVQVCLFHFHAITAPAETPENVPDVLNPANLGTNNYQKLTSFFNISDQARLNEQIRFVRAIGDRLRGYNNVLWELANEVRIQGGTPAQNATGNCGLVAWLKRMRTELITSLQGRPFVITTSTGIDNERVTFSPSRPVDGCNESALPAEYFDFHAGQWGAVDNFATGIANAKARVAGYNRNAFLIVNDDGVNNTMRTADWVKARAKEAFRQRVHYASKQEYPPGVPLDTLTLDKLREANNEQP
ncbi:MAG TPA: hypothetical protein VJZ26_07935 [Blastocatellia bacterium]|nr:hypothetical protein [Blastocatellia bacterium]